MNEAYKEKLNSFNSYTQFTRVGDYTLINLSLFSPSDYVHCISEYNWDEYVPFKLMYLESKKEFTLNYFNSSFDDVQVNGNYIEVLN